MNLKTNNVTFMCDYFNKNPHAAELFPGHRLAEKLGYSYPTVDHPDRQRRLTDGVELKEFMLLDPKDVVLRVKDHQPRLKGVDSNNKIQVKSQITIEGQKDPAYISIDPVTLDKTLDHGHHRHEVLTELGRKIACWVVDYKPRSDGKDTRMEFNQSLNKKRASKAHDLDDALHYLNQAKAKPGYFVKEKAIKDNEKRIKAMRKAANVLLREHYSHYPTNTRGRVVTQWLNGVEKRKVDNPNAAIVKQKFADNNWGDIGHYDFGSNTVTFLIQMGKQGGYVGLAEDMLRKQYAKYVEVVNNSQLAMTLPALESHFKSATMTVVGYTTNAKCGDDLDNLRENLLKTLKEINLDTIFSPNTRITKVLFNPQLLIPNQETKPIVYVWNATNKYFEKLP